MTTKICPVCHSPIPAHAPGGLCPACLLRDAEDPPESGRAVPSLEEIAAAFPNLEVLEKIGQGGMGVVFKVRQPALDRIVALKILLPELGRDPAFAERFAREARVLGKLNHPNIVTVFEHGEREGFFYLLMEFVDGVNLRQAMRAGRFTPEQALAIVPGICDALQAAHVQGIWHRDIKPENILLDEAGGVKIADFGIARIVGDPHRDFTLTRTGNALGSAAYMAPEQHEKPHHVDHRADIYSLGVVLYEMLTGELPLGRFPAPSQRADVNTRIDEIVLRTLEKERELRQQSAAEVKTEVRGIKDHSAADPANALSPRRSMKWPWLLVTAGGVLLAAFSFTSDPFIVSHFWRKLANPSFSATLSWGGEGGAGYAYLHFLRIWFGLGVALTVVGIVWSIQRFLSRTLRKKEANRADQGVDRVKMETRETTAELTRLSSLIPWSLGLLAAAILFLTGAFIAGIPIRNATASRDWFPLNAAASFPDVSLPTAGTMVVLLVGSVILGGLGAAGLLWAVFRKMATGSGSTGAPGRRLPAKTIVLSGVLLLGLTGAVFVWNTYSRKDRQMLAYEAATQQLKMKAANQLGSWKMALLEMNDPARNYDLGPVMERTLPKPAQGVACMFDFESGLLFNPPDDLGQLLGRGNINFAAPEGSHDWVHFTHSRFDWLIAQGIDAMATMPDRSSIRLFQTLAFPMPGDFDKITSSEVEDRVRQALKQDENAGLLLDSFTKREFIELPTPASPSTSFAFISAKSHFGDALVGVMQVEGKQTSPEGVKIRYRLIQRLPDTSGESAQLDRPVERPESAMAGKAMDGILKAATERNGRAFTGGLSRELNETLRAEGTDPSRNFGDFASVRLVEATAVDSTHADVVVEATDGSKRRFTFRMILEDGAWKLTDIGH